MSEAGCAGVLRGPSIRTLGKRSRCKGSALQRGGRSRGCHSQMHYYGKCFYAYVLLFATTT